MWELLHKAEQFQKQNHIKLEILLDTLNCWVWSNFTKNQSLPIQMEL